MLLELPEPEREACCRALLSCMSWVGARRMSRHVLICLGCLGCLSFSSLFLGPVSRRALNEARQGILLAPGSEEAIEAFRKKFPKVMAKERPEYLGTACSEQHLRRRFQNLADTIGREEALGLALTEPLLLAMQEENLRASWEAMLEVAKEDREAALRVVRRRPGCLIGPKEGFKGKTLAEFEAVADLDEAFRPATETLKELGPEGLALGAAAIGMAALGAMGQKRLDKKAPPKRPRR